MLNQIIDNNDNKAMYLSLLFGVSLVLASFMLALSPKPNSKVAVINLPWSPNNHAIFTIAHADARIAAVGDINWIAIAADNNKNLVDRLYQAGAFLVLDAAFLISCGIISG
ncbi:MAG: hypothetical protein HRU29_05950 [Rhizobiales bacterium]|nr:hypothetical protein [Hyphomicrobiales bacterium]NRB13928.1 hypothetical protein [Hyphomicrobiales bacterium]